MVAYELYFFDKIKGYELIGILPERRRNQERITPDSVLNWGKMLLADNADSKKIYVKKFVMEENTGRFFRVNSSLKIIRN